jgi:hypothetical protein
VICCQRISRVVHRKFELFESLGLHWGCANNLAWTVPSVLPESVSSPPFASLGRTAVNVRFPVVRVVARIRPEIADGRH